MKTKQILRKSGLISAFILTSILLASCDGGDNSPTSSSDTVPAPSSIDGQTVNLSMSDGSDPRGGLFGGFMRISNNGKTYRLLHILDSIDDSTGTCTYSTKGSRGVLDFYDETEGFDGRLIFTFSTESSGTYVSSVSVDSSDVGTFEISEVPD